MGKVLPVNSTNALRTISHDPRIHGDGFLQLDLKNGSRLHIWGDPRIPERPNTAHIHDHRFDLISHILLGELRNLSYNAVPDDNGLVHIYRIKRINNGTTEKQGPPYEMPVLEDSQRYKLLAIDDKYIEQGENYFHPHGVLHETQPQKLSVSVVTKPFVSESWVPRVVCRINEGIDNTFSRYCLPEEVLWEIIEDTMKEVFSHGSP